MFFQISHLYLSWNTEGGSNCKKGGCKMFAPHFKDETVGLQKWMFLAGCWPCFWCSFLLWLLILSNLMKNLTLDDFPGRREAPNILHDGKMLAPHFEDEIAGLLKWMFLAGCWPFLAQFFLLWLILMIKPCIFFQKKLFPDVISWPRGTPLRKVLKE